MVSGAAYPYSQVMLTLAITNQKGGVGKTTTTANLSAALGRLGYRVVMVDLDPQTHLSQSCDVTIPDDAESCLARALVDIGMHTPEVAEGLPRPWRHGVDLVPGNLRMFLSERELYRERGAEYRLRRLVELWEAAGRWDVCIIDCPPSLAILSDNALVAADLVVIPVEAEDSSLHALRLLMSQIESVRAELRVDIDVLGMVVNAYDARRGYEVTSTYAALEGMDLPILATVKDLAALRRAWRAGESVYDIDPDSQAAEAYTALAKSLIG